MVRNGVTALSVLVAAALLLGGGAAAHGGEHDGGDAIAVGEHKTVTASVSNPLSVPDVLTVEFNGPAVSSGLVDVDLPDDAPRAECSDATESCTVVLRADQHRDLDFHINGVSPGSSTFMVTVSSETTGKRSEATMAVTVTKGEKPQSFMQMLERMLGIA